MSFLATLSQSMLSKNWCCIISRISGLTFGSATKIFRTKSLVTGVRFFGKVKRPV